MKRTSTVQRLTLCLLNRIRNYCIEMKCGWIFRVSGKEVGATVVDDELLFDRTVLTDGGYIGYDWVKTLLSNNRTNCHSPRATVYVRKIDWVGILMDYAGDSSEWRNRYRHLLATIDA